jgi:hypothetical protein
MHRSRIGLRDASALLCLGTASRPTGGWGLSVVDSPVVLLQHGQGVDHIGSLLGGRACHGAESAASIPTGGMLRALMGEGLNPLAMSQTASNISQANTGNAASDPHTETCS